MVDGERHVRGLMLRRWEQSSEPHLFAPLVAAASSRRTSTASRTTTTSSSTSCRGTSSPPTSAPPSGSRSSTAWRSSATGGAGTSRAPLQRHAGPFADRLVTPPTRTLSSPPGSATRCNSGGYSRSALQAFLDAENVETRAVWTGNVTRQPMMRGVTPARIGPGGLREQQPGDEIRILLPCHHGLSNEDIDYVAGRVVAFLGGGPPRESRPVVRGLDLAGRVALVTDGTRHPCGDRRSPRLRGDRRGERSRSRRGARHRRGLPRHGGATLILGLRRQRLADRWCHRAGRRRGRPGGHPRQQRRQGRPTRHRRLAVPRQRSGRLAGPPRRRFSAGSSTAIGRSSARCATAGTGR